MCVFIWILANVNCMRAVIWGVTWVSVLLHIQTTSEFLFFFFILGFFPNVTKTSNSYSLQHALPVTEACIRIKRLVYG